MLKLKDFTISDKTKKMAKRIAIGAGVVAIAGGAMALGRATMEKKVVDRAFRLLSQSTDGIVLVQFKDGREMILKAINKS